jgi:hypothetical protein
VPAGDASPPLPGARNFATELVLVPERGPLLRVPIVCSASLAIPVVSVGRLLPGTDTAQYSRARGGGGTTSTACATTSGDGGSGGSTAEDDVDARRGGVALARVAASEASRAALAVGPMRLTEGCLGGAVAVGDVVTRHVVLSNAGALPFHAQLNVHTPVTDGISHTPVGAPRDGAHVPGSPPSRGGCRITLSPGSIDVPPFSSATVALTCAAQRAGTVHAALRVAFSAATPAAGASSPLQRSLLREAVVGLEAVVVDPPVYVEPRVVDAGVCLEGGESSCTLTVRNRGSAGHACTPTLALPPALLAALGPAAAAAATAAVRSLVTWNPASAVVQAAAVAGRNSSTATTTELVPGRFDFTLTLRPPPALLTAPLHHALRCLTLLAPEAADGGGAPTPGGCSTVHRALLAVPLRVGVWAQSAPAAALVLATVTPSQLRVGGPALVELSGHADLDLRDIPVGTATSQRVEVVNPSGVTQRFCFPRLPPHVRVLHDGGGGGGEGPAVSVLPPGGRTTVRVAYTAPAAPVGGGGGGGDDGDAAGPGVRLLRLQLRASATTVPVALPVVVTATAPQLQP